MTLDSDPLGAQLLGSLRTSVNADGGWGYFPGKASRLEPTCWALLALLGVGGGADDDPRVAAAIGLIGTWQRPAGLVCEIPSAPPNLAFSGLAAVAVQHAVAGDDVDRGRHDRLLKTLLSGIQRTRGVRIAQNIISRQDNQLTGWPWNDGTFSWVEPTSWCLLALKKASRLPGAVTAAAGIDEAERLLADRCCGIGGWNYGNANMLGKELAPYLPTTALALLALQDRPSLPEVVRSVDWLAGNWPQERSALALSLSLIAMNVHGRASGEIERTIRAHVSDAGPPQNLFLTALMLYALTGTRHGYAALEV